MDGGEVGLPRQEGRDAVREELADLRTRLEERDRQLAALEAEFGRLREVDVERARLAAELQAEHDKAAEKLALLQEAERQLREAFRSLSADALRQNNQTFLDLAKESLGQFQQGAQADLEKRQKAVDELVKPISGEWLAPELIGHVVIVKL